MSQQAAHYILVQGRQLTYCPFCSMLCHCRPFLLLEQVPLLALSPDGIGFKSELSVHDGDV